MQLIIALCWFLECANKEPNNVEYGLLNMIVTMLLLVHMLYWKNSTALSIMKPISTPQIFGYLSVRIAFAAQAQIRTKLLACVKNIVCE